MAENNFGYVWLVLEFSGTTLAKYLMDMEFSTATLLKVLKEGCSRFLADSNNKTQGMACADSCSTKGSCLLDCCCLICHNVEL